MMAAVGAALAQKHGGILKQYIIDGSASMSTGRASRHAR
jgi:hypothetical protein